MYIVRIVLGENPTNFARQYHPSSACVLTLLFPSTPYIAHSYKNNTLGHEAVLHVSSS